MAVPHSGNPTNVPETSLRSGGEILPDDFVCSDALARGRGRPKPQEIIRRKMITLKVAADLFFRDGYLATTIIEIAKCAKVSSRTLYVHFGDKYSLFEESLLTRHYENMIPPFAVPPNATAIEALENLANALLAHHLSQNSIEICRIMMWEYRRFPKLMENIAKERDDNTLIIVSKFFQEMLQLGITNNLDHMLCPQDFIDQIIGSSMKNIYICRRPSAPRQREVRRKVKVFILGCTH